MSNEFYKKIQNFTDSIMEKTIFFLIPKWIKPNLFSWLRIILIPVIMGMIWINFWNWAIIGFLFAILLDWLDGALARKRKQISKKGLILDPLADKLLIGLTLLTMIFYYPFTSLILSVIGFEASIIFLAIMIKKSKVYLKPAIFWGKLKMLLQSLSVIAIMFWQNFGLSYFLWISAILLWTSLIFLIINAINFTKDKKV